jgi:hypothetical protein
MGTQDWEPDKKGSVCKETVHKFGKALETTQVYLKCAEDRHKLREYDTH